MQTFFNYNYSFFLSSFPDRPLYLEATGSFDTKKSFIYADFWSQNGQDVKNVVGKIYLLQEEGLSLGDEESHNLGVLPYYSNENPYWYSDSNMLFPTFPSFTWPSGIWISAENVLSVYYSQISGATGVRWIQPIVLDAQIKVVRFRIDTIGLNNEPDWGNSFMFVGLLQIR